MKYSPHLSIYRRTYAFFLIRHLNTSTTTQNIIASISKAGAKVEELFFYSKLFYDFFSDFFEKKH